MRIFRFCGYSRKFSFGVMASFGGTSEQSMKVFSAEILFPQICKSFFSLSVHPFMKYRTYDFTVGSYPGMHCTLKPQKHTHCYSVKQTVSKGMYKIYKPTTLSTCGVLFGQLVSFSLIWLKIQILSFFNYYTVI